MSQPPPFPPFPAGAGDEARLRRLAAGLNVPVQLLGLDLRQPPPPRPPRSRRERLAGHVGQTGWRTGYTVAQAGRAVARAGYRLERAGDRIIDAGDRLAGRVSGR